MGPIALTLAFAGSESITFISLINVVTLLYLLKALFYRLGTHLGRRIKRAPAEAAMAVPAKQILL